MGYSRHDERRFGRGALHIDDDIILGQNQRQRQHRDAGDLWIRVVERAPQEGRFMIRACLNL
jgi:hypothetical protein